MPDASRPRLPAGDAESEAGLWAGLRQGVLIAAATLVLTLPPERLAALPAAANLHRLTTQQAGPVAVAEFSGHAASADARTVADWVVRSHDNDHLPFVILDKHEARVFAFGADGRIIDSSPVLLGAAAGDDSVVGIGSRPIPLVRPEERTTPAGRFLSAPGRNASGEEVVWVDYDAAVSMHRVRSVDPKERRLARLASPDPAERRISYGCINLPVAFFESVIWPMLGSGRGVVYVLPETRALRQVFAAAYALHGPAGDASTAPL